MTQERLLWWRQRLQKLSSVKLTLDNIQSTRPQKKVIQDKQQMIHKNNNKLLQPSTIDTGSVSKTGDDYTNGKTDTSLHSNKSIANRERERENEKIQAVLKVRLHKHSQPEHNPILNEESRILCKGRNRVSNDSSMGVGNKGGTHTMSKARILERLQSEERKKKDMAELNQKRMRHGLHYNSDKSLLGVQKEEMGGHKSISSTPLYDKDKDKTMLEELVSMNNTAGYSLTAAENNKDTLEGDKDTYHVHDSSSANSHRAKKDKLSLLYNKKKRTHEKARKKPITIANDYSSLLTTDESNTNGSTTVLNATKPKWGVSKPIQKHHDVYIVKDGSKSRNLKTPEVVQHIKHNSQLRSTGTALSNLPIAPTKHHHGNSVIHYKQLKDTIEEDIDKILSQSRDNDSRGSEGFQTNSHVYNNDVKKDTMVMAVTQTANTKQYQPMYKPVSEHIYIHISICCHTYMYILNIA